MLLANVYLLLRIPHSALDLYGPVHTAQNKHHVAIILQTNKYKKAKGKSLAVNCLTIKTYQRIFVNIFQRTSESYLPGTISCDGSYLLNF